MHPKAFTTWISFGAAKLFALTKPMKTSALITLFTVLAGSQMAAPQDPSSRFKVGQPFPNVILPSADDGRPMSLAQYRGKKVLLHIFASW
jgi:hypothetical protein